MSGWIDLECGAVVWAAGLCVVCAAGALMRPLPRDREGIAAGVVCGIAFGMLVALARFVAAMCGVL